MSSEAELLIVGAPVWTGDPARPWADAVAVRGGRVAAVGPERQVAARHGPATRVLALHGGLVLPGFADAHVHTAASGLELAQCSLHGVEPAAYPAAVAGYAAGHPEAAWVLGGGWTMDAFGTAGPRAEALDAVVADRPVLLESSDGHSAWVNRHALELAGITRTTPTHPGAGSSATPPASRPAPSMRRPRTSSLSSPPSPARPSGRRRSSAARPTCTAWASPPGRTRTSTRGCWPPTGPWPSGAGSPAGPWPPCAGRSRPARLSSPTWPSGGRPWRGPGNPEGGAPVGREGSGNPEGCPGEGVREPQGVPRRTGSWAG